METFQSDRKRREEKGRGEKERRGKEVRKEGRWGRRKGEQAEKGVKEEVGKRRWGEKEAYMKEVET